MSIGRSSAAIVAFALSCSLAHAQDLGSLFKALQEKASAFSTPKAERGSSGGASSGGGWGANATERYCRNQFSIAGLTGRKPVDESLISEEFNLGPRDFFDAAVLALGPGPTYRSFAIPSPGFYADEFETDRINVLFNLLRQYPTAQYMAALIAEARATPGTPRYDPQVRADATVALAIVHFFMQDKSRKPDRWRELLASLQGEEHYTSYVVMARLIYAGQWGSRDIPKALYLARDAGGLPTRYRTDNMRTKTVSSRHYQVTADATQYEILEANPGMPQRREFDQFLQVHRAMQNLRLSPDAFPELRARLGPGLAAVEQSARAAQAQAKLLLDSAVDANNYLAQKASLDSATRTRTADAGNDVNVDAATLALLAREMERGAQLTERQKEYYLAALKDARESGDRAVSMMGATMSAMLTLTMQRGVGAAPAMLPYARKLQSYSDMACAVVARLDHAAAVRQLTTGPDTDSRAGLAAMVADK